LGNNDLSWKADKALIVCATNKAPFSLTAAEVPAILNIKKTPDLSYVKVGKKMQAVGYSGVNFDGYSKTFYAGVEYKLNAQVLKQGTVTISANDAIKSMTFTSSVSSVALLVGLILLIIKRLKLL
jgi:hypothetical protein